MSIALHFSVHFFTWLQSLNGFWRVTPGKTGQDPYWIVTAMGRLDGIHIGL